MVASTKIVPGASSEPLQYAATYLPKNAYDYYASGANDNQTLSENTEAYKRLRILPRMMRDVSNIDTNVSLLGSPIKSPICIAPTAMHKMANPEGECATARASTNSCMILSSLSSTSLEDVAKSASPSSLLWFQLYIYKDREITRNLVLRAEKAGYSAIVLTVDTPMLGRREADVRNNFKLPSHLSLENFTGGSHANGVRPGSSSSSGLAQYVTSLFDQTLSWKDVAWLKTITTLPIVVKGILAPEDALIAADVGCSGIIVSNHGARQLDGVPATIEALPDIVEAVKDKIEVYLDGGIRRGTDVFKALALGAKAVFVGRPVLWGLAVDGQAGVSKVLEILNAELKQAMMFSGTASVADIKNGDFIKPQSYYYQQSKL